MTEQDLAAEFLSDGEDVFSECTNYVKVEVGNDNDNMEEECLENMIGVGEDVALQKNPELSSSKLVDKRTPEIFKNKVKTKDKAKFRIQGITPQKAAEMGKCFIKLKRWEEERKTTPVLATPISVKTADRCYSIDLMEHCLFCLRRVTKSPMETSPQVDSDAEFADHLDEVPCAEAHSTSLSAATLLSLLNKTWSRILQEGHWDWNNDTEEQFAEFSRLPTMCTFCTDKISAIQTSLKNLMAEINRLGAVIRESKSGGKYSLRGERFKRAVTSSKVLLDCQIDTLKLLGVSEKGSSSSSANNIGTQHPRRRRFQIGNDKRSFSCHQMKIFEESDGFDNMPHNEDEDSSDADYKDWEEEGIPDHGEQKYKRRKVATNALDDQMHDFEQENDDVKCDTDCLPEKENKKRKSQSNEKETTTCEEEELDFFDEGSDVSDSYDMEYDEINSDEDYTPGTSSAQNPKLGTQNNGKRRSQRSKKTKSLRNQMDFSDEEENSSDDSSTGQDADSSDVDYMPDDGTLSDNSEEGFESFNQEKKSCSPRKVKKAVSLNKDAVLPVAGWCPPIAERVKVEVGNENAATKWSRDDTVNKSNTKALYTVARELGTWKFTCTIDSCGKTFIGPKRNLLLHQSTAHKLGDDDEEKEKDKAKGGVDLIVKQDESNTDVDNMRNDNTLSDIGEKKCDTQGQGERLWSPEEFQRLLRNDDAVLTVSGLDSSTRKPVVTVGPGSSNTTKKQAHYSAPVKKRKRHSTRSTATYKVGWPIARGAKTRKIKFTCVIDGCRKSFPGKRKLVQHQLAAHQVDNDKECAACCIKYTGIGGGFSVHNKNMHIPNVKLMGQICDICDEKVSMEAILDHVRAHVGEEYMIKCPNSRGKCSKVFCTTAGLKVHLRKQKSCRDAIPDVEIKYMKPEYSCKSCGLKADNMMLLRDHIGQSHENGTGNFMCPIQGCEQRFSQRQSVFLHIPLHRQNPTQSCDVCTENVNIDEMEQHLSQVHSVQQEVVGCFQCPSLFAKRENLVDHLFNHGMLNVLLCDVCGEDGPSFNKYDNLRRHYALVHQVCTLERKKAKSEVCKLCDASFSNLSTLKQHVRKLHPGDTNYLCVVRTCDLCKVKIPLKNLHQHVLDHVGEEYLIKCPNTGKCTLSFCTPLGVKFHLEKNKLCRDSISDTDRTKYTMVMDHKVCDVCNYDTTDSRRNMRFSLRNHLLRNHEKDGTGHLSCPIEGCQKRFSVRQSVILHIYLHVKDTNTAARFQKCNTCEEKVDITEMEHHLKDIHGIPEVVKCVQCPFVFPSRENLVDHLVVHRNDVLFCDICGDNGEIFAMHTRLREHYFTEHQIGTKLFCDKCTKSLWTKQGLENHVNKFHTNLYPVDAAQKKRFPCTECEAVFAFNLSLKAHRIKAHGAELLSCKYCDQKFGSFFARSRHEQEHRRNVRHEFPCTERDCGKIFNSKKKMEYHMSSVHVGVKHVCEHCGKAYVNKWGLVKHIQFVHMGLRPYMCDVCGESFYTPQILKRHKRIHTGERPYACEICGQRFRQREALATHVEAHKKRGAQFKPTGAMKHIRKRVEKKDKQSKL